MTANSVLKKIGVLLVFLAGIIIGAGGLWLAIQNNTELRYLLLEKATASLPQSTIAAFVQSIVHNDKAAALKLWEVYDDPTSEQQRALMKRREKVISDLLSAKIEPEYMVLHIEWWSTCCEPGVINDSRSAGGARIHVQFLDNNGKPMLYIFDVFTREPYWGSAEGYQPRDWVIRDVYPYDQDPMYWLLIYEPQIRHVQPSAP
ncbi:MAG: hypothetical protein ACOY0R_04230 [Chloroflexota bacterium]